MYIVLRLKLKTQTLGTVLSYSSETTVLSELIPADRVQTNLLFYTHHGVQIAATFKLFHKMSTVKN